MRLAPTARPVGPYRYPVRSPYLHSLGVSAPPPPPSPELGLGSGITWWQRLRELQDSGVRQKVWHVFLDELGLAYRIDRSKAVVDSRSVRALYLGGAKTGPNPTDRGKNGSKRHLISDCKGIPLAVI